MKDYVNLFYAILGKIETWEKYNKSKKVEMFKNYMNIKEDSDFFVNYFDKYHNFITKNSLKIFTKDILKLKF